MRVPRLVCLLLVWAGTGTGTPVKAQGSPPNFAYWADQYAFESMPMRVRLADLDGDGFVDMCHPLQGTISVQGRGPRVYWNRGNGTCVAVQLDVPPTVDPYAWPAQVLAVGDVDGDGDIDILAPQGAYPAFGPLPPHVFLNHGGRRFSVDTRVPFPRASIESHGGELFDADGDGDLDAVFWGDSRTRGRADRLFLNDGSGRFSDVTNTHLPVIVGFSRHVCVLDVDRDGDRDLLWLVWEGASPSVLAVNDGTGRFAVQQVLPVQWALHAVCGDLNGDGHVDAFVGCDGPPDKLLLNDGTGRLADMSHLLPGKQVPDKTEGAHCVDIDKDGDLDILIASQYQDRIGRRGPHLWINDGTGRFSDVSVWTLMNGNETPWYDVTTGDLDADGDLDIVGTNFDVSLQDLRGRVITGIQSHLYCGPVVARGSSLSVQMYAEPGLVVAPYVGAPMSPVWIYPFGAWGLDPGRMLQLPLAQIGSGGGLTLRYAVPTDPSLSGVAVRVQGALLGVVNQVPVIRTTDWNEVRVQ